MCLVFDVQWNTYFSLGMSSDVIKPPNLSFYQTVQTSDVHIPCCFPPAVVFPDMYNPGAKDVVDVPPPPVQIIVPPQIPPPAAPSIDELIQQSLWNLQQQEQHLHSLRQVQSETFSPCRATNKTWV